MKRLLTFLLVILLLAALVLGAAWYFLDYNAAQTIQYLSGQAANAAQSGKIDLAVQLYTFCERLAPENQELDVALADTYRRAGNYTKAEFTLANAISQGATAHVYETLCRVYVEQDKLLDAVTMLDQIADAGVKAELDARRPAVPTAALEPGFYNQYMDVDFAAAEGALYVSLTREYPSVKQSFEGPVTLDLGETTATAVAVSADGLVSRLGVFGYTIAGVVEPVHLSDAALDAAVREILSRGVDSTLTTSDLWNIEELTISAEVEDLSQLELFTGLTVLTIRNRGSIDLSFLSSMPNLYRLDLRGTKMDPEQLAMIGNLSQLQELNLANCGLSTLRGLENLTTLTSINISVNSISDLTPLAGNTGMLYMQAQNNAIATAAPITGMTNLTSLNISNNMLRDFSPIGALVNLKKLDVSVNNLTKLTGVANLTRLKYFTASSNMLETAAGLGSCKRLLELDLANNKLTEMDELANLKRLEVLDVSYNDIIACPQFPQNAVLSSFNGCHNFLEDVSGLAGLEHLNYVYLDYNNVSDVNVLASCPALVQINVFRTNVTNISDLEKLDIIISYNPT